MNHTNLPIDRSFKEGLISEEEYSSAMLLRKLYYMFFGYMMPKSSTPSIYSKKSIILSDKAARRAYKEVLRILKQLQMKGIYSIILNHCVFDIEFKSAASKASIERALRQLNTIVND